MQVLAPEVCNGAAQSASLAPRTGRGPWSPAATLSRQGGGSQSDQSGTRVQVCSGSKNLSGKLCQEREAPSVPGIFLPRNPPPQGGWMLFFTSHPDIGAISLFFPFLGSLSFRVLTVIPMEIALKIWDQ